MSPYEALSLIVSSVGTLATVYIGLRQLRQNAPRPVPVGGPPAPYGPAHPWPPPPGAPRRPSSVTAASMLLFIAAATHPLAVIVYYTVRFATEPTAAVEEFGGEGVLDVLFFGGVAFLSALIGVFVARGRRFALWSAWVLGALSLVLLSLAVVANVLTVALAPEAVGPEWSGVFLLGYVALVLIAYAVAAALLLTARSRAHFRRA